MISRRRAITILCAAAATPLSATAPTRWRGIALGADVTLELHGPTHITKAVLPRALAQLRQIEALFSLYDPGSALSQLNRTKSLTHPHPDFLALMETTSDIHQRTKGLFDPTVQALWQAHALGRDIDQARASIGWDRVTYTAKQIRLAPDQSLTFNGIAQGFATDRITDLLRAAGLTDIHVNIGEHAAIGPARRLGLVDPRHGYLGPISLQNAALATSSPMATPLGRTGHILSPTGGAAQWSTVSVLAKSATLADGLSTALCLASPTDLKKAATEPDILRVLSVDKDGNLTTYG